MYLPLCILASIALTECLDESFSITDPRSNRFDKSGDWTEWLVKFDNDNDKRANKGVGKTEQFKRPLIPQIRPEELMGMVNQASSTRHLYNKDNVQDIAPPITDHRMSKMYLARQDEPETAQSKTLLDHSKAVESALKEFSKQLTQYLDESSDLMKQGLLPFKSGLSSNVAAPDHDGYYHSSSLLGRSGTSESFDKFLERKLSQLKSTPDQKKFSEKEQGSAYGPFLPIGSFDKENRVDKVKNVAASNVLSPESTNATLEEDGSMVRMDDIKNQGRRRLSAKNQARFFRGNYIGLTR